MHQTANTGAPPGSGFTLKGQPSAITGWTLRIGSGAVGRKRRCTVASQLATACCTMAARRGKCNTKSTAGREKLEVQVAPSVGDALTLGPAVAFL